MVAASLGSGRGHSQVARTLATGCILGQNGPDSKQVLWASPQGPSRPPGQGSTPLRAGTRGIRMGRHLSCLKHWARVSLHSYSVLRSKYCQAKLRELKRIGPYCHRCYRAEPPGVLAGPAPSLLLALVHLQGQSPGVSPPPHWQVLSPTSSISVDWSLRSLPWLTLCLED